MYTKAGIDDVEAFYAEKFAYDRDYDFTKASLNYFDINYFKHLWIYSQVKPGSRVFDFGCGSGALASLKAKGCELTGFDFSTKALDYARTTNRYDETVSGDILAFNNFGQYDYVVSLDVFGHIPFETKDAVIAHLKKLLKPKGCMLHGIECGPVDYDSMSEEELAEFIRVDGHVGVESRDAILARFRRHFRYVQGDVRYDMVNCVDEYLKYARMYHGRSHLQLLRYLTSLDPAGRRAFDIAAGLALRNIEEAAVPSCTNAHGFLFLQAASRPIKTQPLALPETRPPACNVNLILNEDVCFYGFYPAERTSSGYFRWGQRRACLFLPGHKGSRLFVTLFSAYPDIAAKPVEVFIVDHESGDPLGRLPLISSHPVTIQFPLTSDHQMIEFYTDITWIPRLMAKGADTRELGVGFHEIILEPRQDEFVPADAIQGRSVQVL